MPIVHAQMSITVSTCTYYRQRRNSTQQIFFPLLTPNCQSTNTVIKRLLCSVKRRRYEKLRIFNTMFESCAVTRPGPSSTKILRIRTYMIVLGYIFLKIEAIKEEELHTAMAIICFPLAMKRSEK